MEQHISTLTSSSNVAIFLRCLSLLISFLISVSIAHFGGESFEHKLFPYLTVYKLHSEHVRQRLTLIENFPRKVI